MKNVWGSYGAAALGGLVVMELLARRTGGWGLVNSMLLAIAAFYMGGVGMWCMHYLANMGIIFGWGDESYQPVQHPLFCVASLLMPMVGYALAFALLGTAEKPRNWRVIGAGLIAGLVTVGTNVLAQSGITNYDLEYHPGYIAMAGILATVVFIMVFYGLFSIRKHFQRRWYRVIFLALCLALATSGAHWVGIVGTTYRYRKDPSFAQNLKFSNIIAKGVIAMICIAGLAALIMIFFGRRRDIIRKRKCFKVTLASVTFTYDGRIMVEKDGTLPIKTLCVNHDDRTIDEALDTRSSIFQWMFRVSMNWKSVEGILNVMKFHRKDFLNKTDEDPVYWDNHIFSTFFRESYCLTAAKLAKKLRIPITRLGTLYETVYLTGQPLAYKQERDDPERQLELRRSHRGRMLVVNRVIALEEAKKMESLGYRITELEEIIEKLAWSTQTTKVQVSKFMEEVKERAFNEYTHHVGPGVYMGCFVLRPSMAGGFDICVEKKCHGQIPMKKMKIGSVTYDHLKFMKNFDGKKLIDIWPFFKNRYYRTRNYEERLFLKELSRTLQAIVHEYPREVWENSFFIATPTFFPCKLKAVSNELNGAAVIFGLRTMLPVSETSDKYDFVPFQIANITQKRKENECTYFLQAIIREFSKLAKDAYDENQMNGGGRTGFLSALSRVLTPSFRKESSSTATSDNTDSTPQSKTSDPTTGSQSSLAWTWSQNSSNPLICPKSGDWDPVIPSEFEAKDPEGWLEKWFTITTEAEKTRGPAAAARFGAARTRF
ncbi:hypothetical protein L211DRAFT_777761 [Terfezia boudieri ATCC MYA-4762]|uniref:Uncharacterized protein n=1 Tax=Terfezia boudieri ATCC MYA-4762 TaxID=1051890 RepID=A0A3N4M0Q4_9PEZI|nr:hypothetical protein L211DRAFT_777761 [Terfezia boudieri ATCC MYA-4762]